jgi:hypothetical protein
MIVVSYGLRTQPEREPPFCADVGRSLAATLAFQNCTFWSRAVMI